MHLIYIINDWADEAGDSISWRMVCDWPETFPHPSLGRTVPSPAPGKPRTVRWTLSLVSSEAAVVFSRSEQRDVRAYLTDVTCTMHILPYRWKLFVSLSASYQICSIIFGWNASKGVRNCYLSKHCKCKCVADMDVSVPAYVQRCQLISSIPNT